MYRFFYDHDVSGDVLFLLIDPNKKAKNHVSKDNVTAIYGADDKIIGYNFFNISKTMKISSHGIIMTPPDAFVDAINCILEAEGFPSLSYCRDSGYKVAKVTKLEEHPLDEKASIVTLSLGDKEVTTVSHYRNLEVGTLVVVAVSGCILYDGTVFTPFVSRNIANDVSIMSSKELSLGATSNEAFVLNEQKEGNDFFLSECK